MRISTSLHRRIFQTHRSGKALDGEAFLYDYSPKLGVAGMAQILTPDTSQVKGNSWSGKVPLTEDQIEELYQIGRTGALNFSFVETIG